MTHEQTEDLEASHEAKFLTFLLDGDSYGLDIRHVTEIIGMHAITRVPDVPPYVRGIINLRGKVIPVMDVRARFGMEDREYDARTCIIVIHVSETEIGLVVDTVSEVLDIPDADIEPPPSIGRGTGGFMRGVGKVGDHVKLLLDANKLLYATETGAAT